MRVKTTENQRGMKLTWSEGCKGVRGVGIEGGVVSEREVIEGIPTVRVRTLLQRVNEEMKLTLC